MNIFMFIIWVCAFVLFLFGAIAHRDDPWSAPQCISGGLAMWALSMASLAAEALK